MNIPVTKIRESSSNYRLAADFAGKDFEDLISSVKEKGVLMPILVRESKGGFEVIAGNRRLVAAKKAGIKEIPANVVVMNDQEVAEAQIIENMQRKDVHPIEEGFAFRTMIEDMKRDVAGIATRVGKSESYVRGRLFLTNLNEAAARKYRDGKFNDSYATLIAKLSDKDQGKVLKEIEDGYHIESAADLKRFIEEEIYSPLDNQPWLKSEKLMAVVGACKKCPPNIESLFGKSKDGACTDLACHRAKMKIYVEHIAAEKSAVKVSDTYGKSDSGVPSKSEYSLIAAKGKDKCEFVTKAIVSEGSSSGSEILICKEPTCKKHAMKHSSYSKSPAEIAKAKAERKKEIEKKKANDKAREERLKKALDTIKWPLPEKALEALLDIAKDIAGANTTRSVVKRRGLEVKKTQTTWGSVNYDYDQALKKEIAGLDKNGKARLIFELLIDTGYESLRTGMSRLTS